MRKANRSSTMCSFSISTKTMCASSASSRAMAARRGKCSTTFCTSARSEDAIRALTILSTPLVDRLLLLFRFRRRGRLRGPAGVVLAGQFGRFHADIDCGHVVILRLADALQVLIEPADDMLQPLHSMPRLAGTRKLVRLPGEAHHDDRPLQELERTEHLFTAGARRRAIVGLAQHQHQRRLYVLNVGDRRTLLVVVGIEERRR